MHSTCLANTKSQRIERPNIIFIHIGVIAYRFLTPSGGKNHQADGLWLVNSSSKQNRSNNGSKCNSSNNGNKWNSIILYVGTYVTAVTRITEITKKVTKVTHELWHVYCCCHGNIISCYLGSFGTICYLSILYKLFTSFTHVISLISLPLLLLYPHLFAAPKNAVVKKDVKSKVERLWL